MKLKNHTVPSNTKPYSKNSVQQVLCNVSSLRRNSALSNENHDLNLCFSKEKSSLKNTNYDSEEVIQNNSFSNLDQKKNLIEQNYKTNISSNLRGDSFCAEPHCSTEPKESNASSVKQGLSLTKKKELLEKAQGQSTRDIEKILVETDSSCVSYQKEKTRFIGNQKIELKVILDEDCFKI